MKKQTVKQGIALNCSIVRFPMAKQTKGNDMKDEKTKDLLSNNEIDRLMLLMASRDEGATEEEMVECVRWAERVRMEATFLELILDGEVEVRFNQAGIPVFDVTRKGLDRLKQSNYLDVRTPVLSLIQGGKLKESEGG